MERTTTALEQAKESLAYWEQQREVHKPIYWRGSRGSIKRIYDMEDSHLLNVIKNVYESVARARNLPFITEFQEYEGISYENWLLWLTNEYQFRKALENVRTEQEFLNWSDVDALLSDDIAFGDSALTEEPLTLDDIPF